MTTAAAAWLRKRIAEGLATTEWPARAWAKPPALLVHCTEALFAYYLGIDGRVYEYDMDRFTPALEEVTNRETIRVVMAKARELHAEL